MKVQTTENCVEAIRSQVAEEETLGGAEKILFVEDEAFVREVTCEVLQSAGYRVLTAKNTAEAMRLYDLAQSLQSIESGHFDVERDHVGVPGQRFFQVLRIRCRRFQQLRSRILSRSCERERCA